MPNVPLTVWLGGVQATVSYQGRSGCCVGEDQIVFTVPATAPTGCAVPLLVQIGNNISNNTLMPVANGSRTCPVVNPQLAQLDAVQIEQAVSAGSVTYGSIKLAHFSDGGGVYEDDARLQFLKFTGFVRGMQPFWSPGPMTSRSAPASSITTRTPDSTLQLPAETNSTPVPLTHSPAPTETKSSWLAMESSTPLT